MRSIRALAMISALLFAAMAAYTWPLKPGIPAIQLTFSESAFNSILAQWEPAGTRLFRNHFMIDGPFLVCYGALGYFLTSRTGLFSRRTPRARFLLALSLPVAALADAAENAFHLFFLFGAGPFNPLLYLAAGLAASVKWTLIAVFAANSAHALYRVNSRGDA